MNLILPPPPGLWKEPGPPVGNYPSRITMIALGLSWAVALVTWTWLLTHRKHKKYTDFKPLVCGILLCNTEGILRIYSECLHYGKSHISINHPQNAVPGWEHMIQSWLPFHETVLESSSVHVFAVCDKSYYECCCQAPSKGKISLWQHHGVACSTLHRDVALC